MKRSLTLVAALLIAIVLMNACGAQPSQSAMTFKTIGSKDALVFVTLVSPSPDKVSPQDLANRLGQDWQYKLNGNMIEVRVFDNTDAPQRWMALLSATSQEWAKEQAQIYPHWIATYKRNVNSGVHQVDFLSRDANASVVQVIKF